MTHPSSRPQPQTPPGFTLSLESVYLLTDGSYLLSATNGGGDISDDAIQTRFKYSLGSGLTTPSVIGAYELFNVFKGSTDQVAFQTVNGNFITAVSGGGRITDVLHTDAVNVAAWEEFRIVPTGSSGAFSLSIQTNSNNFLTAVGLGAKQPMPSTPTPQRLEPGRPSSLENLAICALATANISLSIRIKTRRLPHAVGEARRKTRSSTSERKAPGPASHSSPRAMVHTLSEPSMTTTSLQ
jgi:hypothetical protein